MKLLFWGRPVVEPEVLPPSPFCGCVAAANPLDGSARLTEETFCVAPCSDGLFFLVVEIQVVLVVNEGK